MAWDDIDLTLLKAGMITRGPALESFTDYLNEFVGAVNDRNRMIVRWVEADTWQNSLDYSDLSFSVGAIRAVASNDFWSDFKELLSLYKTMWNATDYYLATLFDDPENGLEVNLPNFVIDDADLIAVIGQSAYDTIFVAPAEPSLLSLMKADVYQAMYHIIRLTAYPKQTIQLTNTSPVTLANLNRGYFYRQLVTTSKSIIGGSGDDGGGAVNGSFGVAAAEVTASLTLDTNELSSDNLFNYTTRENHEYAPTINEWDLLTGNGRTYGEMYYKAVDNDGVKVLLPVFSGQARMVDNVEWLAAKQVPAATALLIRNAPVARLPQYPVCTNGNKYGYTVPSFANVIPPMKVNETFLDTTTGYDLGITIPFYLDTNEGEDKSFLNLGIIGQANYVDVSPFQEFGNAFVEMFNPQKIFININNVAFDYSVPAASAGILVDPNDPFA